MSVAVLLLFCEGDVADEADGLSAIELVRSLAPEVLVWSSPVVSTFDYVAGLLFEVCILLILVMNLRIIYPGERPSVSKSSSAKQVGNRAYKSMEILSLLTGRLSISSNVWHLSSARKSGTDLVRWVCLNKSTC